MNRSDIIKNLQSYAPLIVTITFSDDMGYEFSAIVHHGVINSEPGMLLDYSNGRWPPDEWADMPQQDSIKMLSDFLINQRWSVIGWDQLSDIELDQWLEDAEEALGD